MLLLPLATFAAAVPAVAGINALTSLGPYSSSVTALAIDPINSQILYASTADGLFKSTDQGANWLAINNGLPTNIAVNALVIAPTNSEIVYAITSDHAVYKTTDGGANWSAIANGLAVFTLVIDPTSSQTVYAGTDVGVYKTTDGGANWSAVSNVAGIHTLVIDPANSQTVYATNGGAIIKTTDGGANWFAMTNFLRSSEFISTLVIDPGNSQILYAGTGGGISTTFQVITFGAVYKTTDGGANWSAVLNLSEAINSLVIDPTNSQILYVAASGENGTFVYHSGFTGTDAGGIYKTTDGGADWSGLNSGLPLDATNFTLVFDPSNSQILYTVGGGFFKTSDGGMSWSAVYNGLPTVTDAAGSLVIDPANDQILYAVSKAGVLKTGDRGMNWLVVNNGLPAPYYFINSQNCQPYQGCKVTSVVFGVSTIVIAHDNSQILYAGTSDGDVYKTTDGAANWSQIASGLAVSTLAIDPTNSQIVYAGTSSGAVYKTTNGGAKWHKINNGLPSPGKAISTLAIDPTNSQIVYAGTRGVAVYKTTDGGAKWHRINNGLPSPHMAISTLVIDPTNSQIIYAGTGGGVYKTSDGGANWYANGPAASTLVIDPTNSQIIYAGTSMGVYKTRDGGADWYAVANGLNVSTLVIDPANSHIVYAATSSGVFEMTRDLTKATHFRISAPASTKAGEPVSFTVRALNPANNVVTNYSGTVHFTSTDGAAILPADTTLTNGAGTFSATLVTAGKRTITATDTVSPTITGTTGKIKVRPAAATHFLVTAPSGVTAGIAFTFNVAAVDQFNNVATAYAGTVHFESTDEKAKLPADAKLVDGQGNFSAKLKTAGSGQAITAKDTIDGSITGTSGAINVKAATTHFLVTAPLGVTAGVAFTFSVTPLDKFDNPTEYVGTLHFESTDKMAKLPVNTNCAFGPGTINFSATLKTAGSQTITVKDTVNGSVTGTSNVINVQ